MSINEQLWEAVLENDPETNSCVPKVEELLKLGANINTCNDDFVTPLQVTAAKGDLEMAQLLIDHGADVNKADQLGFTPFLHACSCGHIEMVVLLLKNKANHKSHTYLGATAMTLAFGHGYLEVVKFLHEICKISMEPLPRFAWCPSPLMAAAFYTIDRRLTEEQKEKEKIYDAEEMLIYLLDPSPPLVDVNHQLPEFCYLNALALAVICKKGDIFDLLIEFGANPELCIGTGETINELNRSDGQQDESDEFRSPKPKLKRPSSDGNNTNVSTTCSTPMSKCLRPSSSEKTCSTPAKLSCIGENSKTLQELLIRLRKEDCLKSKKRSNLFSRLLKKI